MTWGAVSSDHWAEDARPALTDAKATFLSEARAASLLCVEFEPPRPAVRGRLCLFLEGAIERALDARGAPPPARPSAADRDEIANDQLRRAIVSGTDGIALWLSSLAGITGADDALDSNDSATLRWWLAAADERPIRLGFDRANLRIGVYLEPRTLESLIAEAVAPDDATPEETADEGPASDDDVSLDAAADHAICSDAPSEDVAQASGPANDAVTFQPPRVIPVAVEPPAMPVHVPAREAALPAAEPGLAESARAMAEGIADDSDTGWLRHALMEISTPAPAAADWPAPRPAEASLRVVAESAACVAPPAPLQVEEPLPVIPAPPLVPDLMLTLHPPTVPAPPMLDEELPEEPVVEQGLAVPRLELRLADAAEPAAVVEAKAPDVEADAKRKLEACWRELSTANGPKPLAVVERLFSSAYMPLRAALDGGADLPALRETADDWSQSFEKSYKDGFDALRVRNKRPAMVVDVPDIALRVARLHGARSTQLLLVDSMRFDIGDMVNDRIRGLVGQRAACAERFLLWAALPTNTATQIELIGRGPAGLREPIVATGEDLLVGRGRKAQMVRRLKTGHRELLKLDIVAARLTEPHGAEPSGFSAIADEVAQRIAAHFEGLQPRTLVMIFGDHGFAVDKHADGRHGLTEGGASPEEVLVPAFAWLVGAIH
jgi:hypothetical protein